MELINEVSELLDVIKNIKCFFVINREIVNTPVSKEIKQSPAHDKIEVLRNHICQRVEYIETAVISSTVAQNFKKNYFA